MIQSEAIIISRYPARELSAGNDGPSRSSQGRGRLAAETEVTRSILARRSLVEWLWRRPLLAIDSYRMGLDLQLIASGELARASFPSQATAKGPAV